MKIMIPVLVLIMLFAVASGVAAVGSTLYGYGWQPASSEHLNLYLSGG
ncbi:hypothetical protein GCM10011348_04670 [Marinobacterium nitratireducens]|uniref:Uncharacterized protein n=1 Tax=Marinobacterium nitratireducens TaxID=518897 RepID=A0A918DPP7_9GAMM|nr:hypothetical protein [Marinobacterium nitratireducens]GGO76742.1 hypothetical protein GCM10011348_04670 [Marinobacterium nitratireducens]